MELINALFLCKTCEYKADKIKSIHAETVTLKQEGTGEKEMKRKEKNRVLAGLFC